MEAGSTSGARRQAEHALRHGKRLFLLERLVEDQEWARALIGQPGVLSIESPDEIDGVLATIERELGIQADVLV